MKKGKPMMWSQCTWDMKMWKVWPVGPRVASTWLPNTRAPEPRSQSTYSSPPVTSSTHEESPPKVLATVKSSSRSTNARASRAAPAGEGGRRRRRRLGEGLGHGGKDGEHLVESTDGEDLERERLEGSDRDGAALRLGLLGGKHEDVEPFF